MAVTFKINNLLLILITLISFWVVYYALGILLGMSPKWEGVKRLLLFIFIICEFMFCLINELEEWPVEDIERYSFAYEGMKNSTYCCHLPENITDFNVLDFYYYSYESEKFTLYVATSEKVIKEYVDYLSKNAIWQGSLSNRQLNNMSNFSIDNDYAIGDSDNKNTVIYILHRDYQKKTIEYIAVDDVQKEMLFFCEKRNY